MMSQIYSRTIQCNNKWIGNADKWSNGQQGLVENKDISMNVYVFLLRQFLCLKISFESEFATLIFHLHEVANQRNV